MCVFHPSLTGDLSLVRYVWDVFHVLLGRVRSSHQKPFRNLEKLKNLKPDLHLLWLSIVLFFLTQHNL